MCCVCAGVCSHIGNHGYCYAHDPARQVILPYTPPPAFPTPGFGGGFIATPSMSDIEGLRAEIARLTKIVERLAEAAGVDVETLTL